MQLRDSRILITGGTGFVGKWLLSTLLDANQHYDLGCRVDVLSRDPKSFMEAAPFLANSAAIQLIPGDVRHFSPPPHDYSYIIHAAADVVADHSPIDAYDVCVEGTRRILDIAARQGKPKILIVSSGAVYGPQLPTQSTIPETYRGALDFSDPNAAYGMGKRCAEWLAAAYAEKYGLAIGVARCFAFVGPYLALDRHLAIGNFLRDALNHQPVIIRGDGTSYRSYLHATDLATWLWAILLAAQPGATAANTYNVGSQEAITVRELAERVIAIAGSRSKLQILKQSAAGLAGQRYVPNVAKAVADLNLEPPLTLDNAIFRTVQWLRSPSKVVYNAMP
jgi:dTDP-glucose 4,6-dehydratase